MDPTDLMKLKGKSGWQFELDVYGSSGKQYYNLKTPYIWHDFENGDNDIHDFRHVRLTIDPKNNSSRAWFDGKYLLSGVVDPDMALGQIVYHNDQSKSWVNGYHTLSDFQESTTRDHWDKENLEITNEAGTTLPQ